MSISQLDNYVPIGWQNYASGGTPINAANLNHGDSAIDANRDKINEVVTAVNEATSYIEATETLTGNPVEITTAVAENLSGCEVTIVAQQDGTPSPSSPVAITGMSSVTVSNAESGADYTFNIGSTCYGGTLDTKTGVLTTNYGYIEFDGSDDEGWTTRTTGGGYTLFETAISGMSAQQSATQLGLCNKYPWNINLSADYSYRLLSYNISVREDGVSLADFKSDLSSTPLQIVYPLTTPTTTTLTAQEIALIVGENTLSTDGNSMTASYSVSLADILRRLKALES